MKKEIVLNTKQDVTHNWWKPNKKFLACCKVYADADFNIDFPLRVVEADNTTGESLQVDESDLVNFIDDDVNNLLNMFNKKDKNFIVYEPDIAKERK